MSRIKLAIAAGAVIAAAGGGWSAKGWHEDSKRLAAEQAAQKVISAAMARESRIAQQVEDRLAELQASERIIDRGIIREVQKPVYQRVCLEPDAIRLLNHAAAGTAADTTNLDDAVPGAATKAE